MMQNNPEMSDSKVQIKLLLLVVMLIVVLDQLTKYISDMQLSYAEAVSVFPGFDLLLVYNKGAAFSFLADAGGWQRWILTGISAVVSVGLLMWLCRVPREEKLLGLALAIILGGAIGNFIDRLLLGHVIDFISVYAGEWRFATFNIADAAISVGAALLVLDLIVNREKHAA